MNSYILLCEMKVTADDFRRTYADLSDEALLEMNREELTAVAQEVYDEELASRGLAAEGEEAGAAAASTSEADLVEVARFDNTDELDLARALLKSANIPSFLSSDPSLPGIFRATRSAWHELYVRSDDVEEALAVIESEISEEELAAQAEAAGETQEELEHEDFGEEEEEEAKDE